MKRPVHTHTHTHTHTHIYIYIYIYIYICDVMPRDFEGMLVFYSNRHFEDAHKTRQLHTKLNVIICALRQ